MGDAGSEDAWLDRHNPPGHTGHHSRTFVPVVESGPRPRSGMPRREHADGTGRLHQTEGSTGNHKQAR